jgi:hypothetical protein
MYADVTQWVAIVNDRFSPYAFVVWPHTGDIRRVIRSAGNLCDYTGCWYGTVHRVADSDQPRTAFTDRRCDT